MKPTSLQMPNASEIEARQQEFSTCVSSIVDGVAPVLRERSGMLHALAFESEAVSDPRLTPKDLADALHSIEVG